MRREYHTSRPESKDSRAKQPLSLPGLHCLYGFGFVGSDVPLRLTNSSATTWTTGQTSGARKVSSVLNRSRRFAYVCPSA
jgi:hypothetical protein